MSPGGVARMQHTMQYTEPPQPQREPPDCGEADAWASRAADGEKVATSRPWAEGELWAPFAPSTVANGPDPVAADRPAVSRRATNASGAAGPAGEMPDTGAGAGAKTAAAFQSANFRVINIDARRPMMNDLLFAKKARRRASQQQQERDAAAAAEAT
eukprot:gene34112-29224_t